MRRYLEFAVGALVLSVLVIVLSQSLGKAQRAMEEAGVQAEAAGLRTQLIERLAHRETFGGTLPQSDNPLDWVSNRPPNYLGARDGVPKEIAVWYFDKRAGELVYRFRDGHLARFQLSRAAGSRDGRGVIAGVGLLRLSDQPEQSLRK